MTEELGPTGLKYTQTHEWIRLAGDEATVGITDHAQQELTDVVFVDLPKVGALVTAGGSVMVIESVKTVADVYAPYGGVVTAVNDALKAHPELVNRSPYADGWLFRVRLDPANQVIATLSAEEYAKFASGGGPAP